MIQIQDLHDTNLAYVSDVSNRSMHDIDFDGISNDDAKDSDIVSFEIEDDNMSFVFSDNDDMPSDRGGSNGL